MRIRLPLFGIAVAGTLVGAVVGSSDNAPPEVEHVRARGFYREVRQAKWVTYGAIVGAVVGVACDLALRGFPPRTTWTFNSRMLLATFIALAIFFNGARCFLKIVTMPP